MNQDREQQVLPAFRLPAISSTAPTSRLIVGHDNFLDKFRERSRLGSRPVPQPPVCRIRLRDMFNIPFSHQQCLIFFSAKVSIIFQTSKRFLILSLLYEVYSPSFAAFVIFLLSLPRKTKHRDLEASKHRSIGASKHRSIETSELRNIGASKHRSIEASEHRNIKITK